ncbi:pre-peptidase C-terminal domain-containing protein [Haloarcula pellucida]|uniref:Peptidase C-terminal archaeal/bacterial domain-containing protein n=1 Tax=Haloarcula pellucida TaxID=1427151 RepID=A0A830GHD6_9EURY|nr:pre-peptidase C-terminal domain-containing protein [Halomicroarcula pellucida]MBX0347334.1 PGF-pre-PGF domain-containing protein [Halomicroarcula pellucida]GGN88148.1 hypothetical protein GCM10009030_07560 [Halomicroarcula pellucida]
MPEQTQQNTVRRRRGVRLVAVVVAVLVAVAGPIGGVGVVASAPATDDTREIAYGETVSGAVDSVDPIRSNPTENSHTGDFYYEPVSFEGEAGDLVDVQVFAPTDTSLVLVGPDGQELAHNEDGGEGNNSQITHRLPSDGTYTIQVTSHFSEDHFEYLLSLDQLEESEDLEMAVGDTVAGTVDETNDESYQYNGRYETVQIDGAVGQEVELSLSSSEDSALYIIAPNGKIVAEEVAPYSGRDATIQYTFGNDLPHTVVVATGDFNDQFSYILTAEDVTNVTENETDTESGENASNNSTASSTDDGDDQHAGTSHGQTGPAESTIEILDSGLNRTSATLGSSVEYTVSVANYGDKTGTFDRPVVVDGQPVARLNGTVEPYQMRTITTEVTLDRTGQFQVSLDNESAETLTAVPPTAPEGNTVAISDDTQIGFEPNATTGEAVQFTFDTTSTDATLRSVSIDSAGSGTLWLEAVRTQNLSAGGPPADGVTVAHGFVLSPSLQTAGNTTQSPVQNGTVTLAVDRTALGDTPEASVVLYRYDEASSSWIPLQTTRVASAADTVTYRAQTTTFSTIAVGTVDPVSTTGSLSKTAISADETVTVSATLRNDGSAAVERTVPITVDGNTVTERTVSVPAGGERTVSASLSPAAGTHDVGVGGTSVGTLTVEAVTTEAEVTTSEAATEATTTGGSGAGFGVLAALLAVTAALLTAIRRRV